MYYQCKNHLPLRLMQKVSSAKNNLKLVYLTIKGYIRRPFNSCLSVRQFILGCIEKPVYALDLGCGLMPQNIFQAKEIFGVDICDSEDRRVIKINLIFDKLPFEDNSLDVVTAFDFLEHIPRITNTNNASRLSFVELMNEIHRVLKPSGIFLSKTPTYPSPLAFKDPTHVNIITESTLKDYFCFNSDAINSKCGAYMYGFSGKFVHLKTKWLLGHWTVSLLKAEK